MTDDKYEHEVCLHGDLREHLEFSNGEVSFGAYSYHIDSYGNGDLSKEETYKLYLAMKSFYEKTLDTIS